MKIFRVVIQVSDILRAQTFYSVLLGISGVRISPGRHYFDCDGVILACFDPRADGDDFDAKPNPDDVYISTNELENVFERAKRLEVATISEIEIQPWGGTFFLLERPF